MQRILDPVGTGRLQQSLWRQLPRQCEDAHVGGGLAVDLAGSLDATEGFEAGELVVLGKSLRLDDDADAGLDAAVPFGLGLGVGGGFLPALGSATAARQARASDNSES